MSDSIAVQFATLEHLAEELGVLGAELAAEADLCRSATATIGTAIDGEAGARAGELGTSWAGVVDLLGQGVGGGAEPAGRGAVLPGARGGPGRPPPVRGGRGAGPVSTSTLVSLASWDPRMLGNAVGTLGAVGERLVSWRARVEDVGRTLEATECWEGPAGQAAAGALRRVSGVVTEVTAVLTRSLVDADRMVVAARTASDLAGEALAAAAAIPAVLDDRGELGPLPAVPLGSSADPAQALEQQYDAAAEQAQAAARVTEWARGALQSADQAAAAAADAVAVLGGSLGTAGGSVPAGYLDLVAHVGPGTAAPVPPPPDPPGVAAWWAAMSEEQRRRWIEDSPGLVGVLDGVPAWARDQANRLVLDRVLPGDPGFAVAVATANEIRAREEAGAVVQLYEFAPRHELVALVLGDLDTADAVGLVVPGVGNDPVEDLDDVTGDAAAVAGAAMAAAPGLAVATVAYLGYRPPSRLDDGLAGAAARTGGVALDRALDGIAATRTADAARVTVVAHSYGTVATDRAADAPGALAADAVVLLGSPGVDNDRAGFAVDEVYEASAGADPITWLELHGGQTWDPDTGLDAVPLPTEADMTHVDYLDPGRPTLQAIGEVVAGTHDG